ncbi:hypothetical protein VFPPC_17807 [Pochonia chlamydosporia 170]|uniref:Uncharacterized protein n=1 Tax=Pochonia chlamydosporia 170 TaxID=1380566 RepID=A0A219AQD3_METCM|nr:hypothetical protein VFPPC_17807 [Pochonia chlamydosporia 170]OWT43000.1 hypothetical protein VFPPC_17807 [Pochonia chlamydosporia 170]
MLGFNAAASCGFWTANTNGKSGDGAYVSLRGKTRSNSTVDGNEAATGLYERVQAQRYQPRRESLWIDRSMLIELTLEGHAKPQTAGRTGLKPALMTFVGSV